MDMPPISRALYRNAQDRARASERAIQDLERETGQDPWRERRLRELHDQLAADRAKMKDLEDKWR